ncbi:MFS transporter [Demequina salsinemoris]|uniref:MFS transporter n=1 Tax=Demequina salsinemoris TaxID=577470 RepID=UPI00078342D9|nr:MFS transporter [Demequina salsinemoris]
MNLSTTGYLAASFLSALGNSAAAVALPLVILTTTGDPLSTGIVAAATAVPTIVVGLVAGVVVDRANRRDVAVVSDVVSALAVVAIPVVDGAIGLSLGWFIGLAIAGAVGDAPGASAREAMAPAIARASGAGLDRVLGFVQGATALAMVAGPALAGGVIAVSGPTAVLGVTAAASALAAGAGLLVPRHAGAVDDSRGGDDAVARDDASPRLGSADTASGGGAWGAMLSLREGWRVLAGSPTLAWATVLSAGSVAVTGSLQGLVLPAYALRIDRPGLAGAVLAAFAGAAIVGALAYGALADGRTRRAWFVGGVAGALVGLVIIAPLSSPTLVIAGAAVLGLSAGPLNSAIGAALVDLTPDRARGRVLAVQNAFVLAAVPLGVLGAGLLAGKAGLSAATWAGVAMWTGITLIAAFAPAMRGLDAGGRARERG